MLDVRHLHLSTRRIRCLNGVRDCSTCDVEICAYSRRDLAGRLSSPQYAPTPQRPPSPNWSNGIPRRQESSPEEAPSFRSRITQVRSIAGELYSFKALHCYYDPMFTYAADRRHSDGRGWTIRDESIAPVAGLARSLPLGTGQRYSVEMELVSLPYRVALTFPPSSPTMIFFSYLSCLGTDRTDRD